MSRKRTRRHPPASERPAKSQPSSPPKTTPNRAADVLEHWFDLDFVDPYEFYADSYGHPTVPASYVEERSDGNAGVVFRNERELANVRGLARLVSDTNTHAIGILNNLTNFTVGTGFKYTATSKSKAPPELVRQVQSVIDEFIDDNNWNELERELFVRSRRDGEFFLWFFPQEYGRCQVRTIEPAEITEPADHTLGVTQVLSEDQAPRSFSWSFGIMTDADDVETVHGYHYAPQSGVGPGEFIPAREILHGKINVDRKVKRGLTDFFPLVNELEGVRRLLRNVREGASIQAAIAWIREHADGTTKRAVERFREDNTDYTRPSISPRRSSRTMHHSHYEPGTILDVPAGTEYKPAPLGSAHGPNFVAISQAILRSVGVRWCLPEYMVSGDASNNNYASSLVAESPFVKNAEASQSFYKRRFYDALWRVIRIAADAGRFGEIPFEQVAQLIEIQVEPPAVAVRNREQDTNIRKVLHEAGILSATTWAAMEDLDYEAEQANRRREQATATSNPAPNNSPDESLPSNTDDPKTAYRRDLGETPPRE